MSNIDLLGHIFMACMLAGKWLLAHHYRCGWLVYAVSAVGWIGLGYALGMSSIVIWQSIFAVLYLYAYRKWSLTEGGK